MMTLDAVRRVLGRTGEVRCREAQEIMSSFIDLMAAPDEVELLENHLAVCPPCQRQLQAYISVKHLMGRIEASEVPTDLPLETRVRLSRVRHPVARTGIRTRLLNSVRHRAVPMLAGTCVTALFFALLLSTLITPSVIASDGMPRARVSLYRQVRTTDPTITRLVGSSPNLREPLTVETLIDVNGRVIDYMILAGPSSPEVDRWLRDVLYFAKFTPATVFGRPVSSRAVLSFVGAN